MASGFTPRFSRSSPSFQHGRPSRSVRVVSARGW
jgi:hypothetical protein